MTTKALFFLIFLEFFEVEKVKKGGADVEKGGKR